MEKYKKYKNSGIDWLGEIPEHWKTNRIDWVNKIVRGNTAFKKDELLNKGEYVALQYGKTYKVDEVNNTFKYFVNNEFYKKSQIVNCGDIILISTSETLEDLGHSCFYNRNDLGLLGGEQILLKSNDKIINDKFQYYYSKFFCVELKKYATGLKVFRFNIDDLKNIFILIPKLKEQTEIANYLDAKTQTIDKKVKLLSEKISTYKDYRKTLINQTVTKGLDKNVKLKNSGINWIGEIPKHWEVKRLKSLGNISTSSVNKKIEEDEKLVYLVNYTDVFGNLNKEIWNDLNYMKVSAKSNQIIQKNLKKGDVLFTPSSETVEDIGVSSVVMEDLKNTLYSYHILRLRFSQKIYDNFKKYIFNNDFVQYYFSKSAKGTTRKILGLNDFNNLQIVLPNSLKEQQAIANYLDVKTQTIDTIIKNIEKQITTLKELRKTLINEVVTGNVKITE
ncbi:restriction endonuclease subunit S [Tenacibaculum piscium]|uniref:restriction endonuclease subunit S n=1 Tax=Tenacibaculum piscium TaxID=1458515 RepID=UPI00187B5F5B|nr:restriction endonuclease subunit S [Tenacibaculum piscium]MBE7671082.1 restriction endonuclease subunit S [Tenacibaculum piscium]